ncbi:hypothetical protein [Kribbella soli]|uniref:Uncharacterized protein n=1 Tax=Kribbella soli TaxID=1124743 RepID=A0A4R0HSB5_9ACTN|nr:hypothetical protein [Kribbella soli]TCC10749.1 hypothetical protein E0H45_05410 [Kribbella soli]
MPEQHDPEQELGPKITSAFQDHAGAQGMEKTGLAREARRRVHRRRQALSMAAGAVLVVAAVGGVWGLLGGESPVATSSDSASEGKAASAERPSQGIVPNSESEKASCPVQHPIQQAAAPNDVPTGTGLDLSTQVTGLRACRYSTGQGGLLGQQEFDAAVAQQVVDAIKVLPERNPGLPVFKCAPQAAKPSEAIALRFTTAAGVKEIWVVYDGCTSAGFFTGSHVYGLYSAPLKLFMTGTVRPSGGTYLSALKDW